jgi:hypothetical protein
MPKTSFCSRSFRSPAGTHPFWSETEDPSPLGKEEKLVVALEVHVVLSLAKTSFVAVCGFLLLRRMETSFPNRFADKIQHTPDLSSGERSFV